MTEPSLSLFDVYCFDSHPSSQEMIRQQTNSGYFHEDIIIAVALNSTISSDSPTATLYNVISYCFKEEFNSSLIK